MTRYTHMANGKRRSLIMIILMLVAMALTGSLIYSQSSQIIASWDRLLLRPAETSLRSGAGPRPQWNCSRECAP